MAQQALPYGQSDNDPNPANSLPIREAWKRTGEMFSDLYSSLTTITDAGAFEFSGELTTEEKIDAAIASALASGDTIVRIPFAFLPYNVTLLTNLAAFTAASGRLVREGGDFTTLDALAYGAAGLGLTDDTPAFHAMLLYNAERSRGVSIDFPPGSYLLASDPFAGISFIPPTTIRGGGIDCTILLKGFNGTWFSRGVGSGNFLRWENITFDGQHGTYTGTGFDYAGQSGGVGNDYHSYHRCRFTSITGPHFSFGIDGGQNISFVDCEAYPGSGQTEYEFWATTGTDTGARFRRMTHSVINLGYLTVAGMVDTFINNSAFKRLETNSVTSELFVNNSLWGNLSAAMSISGSGVTITGCRFSGNVTLTVNFSGQFVGNFQTAGTFTNQTNAGNAIVLHHPLSTTYNNLGYLTWSATKNPEEVQTFRVSTNFGDTSPAQQAMDQGPTIMYFDSPLTAPRAVTLPAMSGAVRDGKIIRTVRTKASTGADGLTVNSTPAVVLATGQWTDSAWRGPSAVWVPVAGGTLP